MGPPPNDPIFWKQLDGIAVINLDNRPERWAATQAELAAFPGIIPATRISAVRGSDLPGFGVRPWFRGRNSDLRWASRVGCTQSHRKTMAYAREKGWRRFLVLEDDVSLQPLQGVSMNKLQQVLFNREDQWDVCYMGFSKAVGPALMLNDLGNHHLFQVTGCYTTHAYLVRERARDWILAQLPPDSGAWRWHAQHRIIDRWYVRHLSQALRVLAVSPSVVTQRAGFSDIAQRQVDYSNAFAGRLQWTTHCRVGFTLRQRWAHLTFLCGDGYDWGRGLFKRFNGF